MAASGRRFDRVEIKLRQNGVLYSETSPRAEPSARRRRRGRRRRAKRDEGGRPIARNVRLDEVAATALDKLDAEARAGDQERTNGDDVPQPLHTGMPFGRKRSARLGGSDVTALIARLRRGRLRRVVDQHHGSVLRHILRGRSTGVHDQRSLRSRCRRGDLPQQRARDEFDARVLPSGRDRQARSLRRPGVPQRRAALAAYGGLRASEIAGLIWDDVSFVDGCVHVRAHLEPFKKGEPPRRVKLKSRASTD